MGSPLRFATAIFFNMKSQERTLTVAGSIFPHSSGSLQILGRELSVYGKCKWHYPHNTSAREMDKQTGRQTN